MPASAAMNQVAEQHRGRADLRLTERHRGEFERQTPGLPDAALDPLGDVAEMAMARVELAEGLADTDHRPPVEDVIGETLRLHPAAMDEAVAVALSVTCGGAERFAGHARLSLQRGKGCKWRSG